MENTKEKSKEEWEVSKHATPEHSPQYGIYVEGERNDFCIVTGEDAEAKAHLISAAPEFSDVCNWLEDVMLGDSNIWIAIRGHEGADEWAKKLHEAISKSENQK